MLTRGCDTTNNQYRDLIYQVSILAADATISLPKVRKLLSEQNRLERRARDCDSQVCQVSQTLLFMIVE